MILPILMLKDDTDKCYKTMQGAQRGAAWHNVVLANDEFPKFDRGDSFRYTFVKDGPTWIPTGGYVGFHDTSQIEEYELDIDMIVEKNVINKLDHIMYGIGLSNDMLRDEEGRTAIIGGLHVKINGVKLKKTDRVEWEACFSCKAPVRFIKHDPKHSWHATRTLFQCPKCTFEWHRKRYRTQFLNDLKNKIHVIIDGKFEWIVDLDEDRNYGADQKKYEMGGL